MHRSNRNLAIALMALVLLIVVALSIRGCDRRQNITPHEESVAAAPPLAPDPTPEQSARKGQIYFHRDLSLAKIVPGEGIVTRLPDLAGKGLEFQYQIQSDRLSPDATRMIYGTAVVKKVGDGFGTFPPEAIYLRQIATADAGEKLVAMEGKELREFMWSPDGAHVAFTSWEKDSGIRNWVVDVATKEIHELKLPRRHAADGKDYSLSIAAWSPDAKWIAAGDQDQLYLVEVKRGDAAWIWSGRGRLTRDPHKILGGSCSFSPDGTKVLFVALDEGVRMTLWTAAAGGNDDRLVVAPGKFTDVSAAWSPDGRRIAFSGAHLDSAGKRAGRSGIYIIDAAGSDAEPTPVLEEVHPPELIHLRLVDWR
jgi:Tol biopolymer transport system component